VRRPARWSCLAGGSFTAAALDENGDPIPPYHITGTFTGTVTAVPEDPSLPTYTGHFTTWFGENSNQKTFNDTDTFTVILTGNDGSTVKFHDTFHVTVNAKASPRNCVDGD
jgi:hypothetical protein